MTAFAVLLARALLPGAVMLDPVSAPDGGLALVMCSGHGPLFPRDAGAMAEMPDAMSDMDMSHMAGAMQDGMDMSHLSSDSPAPNSMAADDGLCAFSAALAVACVAIALAVVLFALTRATESWSPILAHPPVRSSLHFRPLSRAPPLFS